MNANEDIFALASAAIDGSISETQAKELETLLAESEENRRIYVRFMTLSATLLTTAQDSARAQKADAQLQSETPLTPAPRKNPSVLRRIFMHPARRTAFIAAAAACLALAAILSITSKPATPLDTSVAKVVDAGNAVYAGSTPMPVGTRLEPGTVHLASGLVRIDFDSGATIRLEGPADLEIVDKFHARLTSGKLVASVPQPAHGFTVDSPLVRVVDLGTMFGLDLTSADKDGKPLAAVHVFEGTVQLERSASPDLQLHQDEAIAVGSAVDLRFPADSHSFQDWDFGNRRGGHAHWGSPLKPQDFIFLAMNADSVRRAILREKVDALVQACRGLNGDGMMEDAVWRARGDLFNATLQTDSTDEDLAAKLSALREAKSNARQALELARQSLRESLTAREEASLLLSGWLE